jgi:transcriptional regulator with PAS, ATPase and Fis domain
VEDIFSLCQRALVRFAQDFGKQVPELDPEARTLLERYHYPGNIRELRNSRTSHDLLSGADACAELSAGGAA